MWRRVRMRKVKELDGEGSGEQGEKEGKKRSRSAMEWASFTPPSPLQFYFSFVFPPFLFLSVLSSSLLLPFCSSSFLYTQPLHLLPLSLSTRSLQDSFS